MRRLPLLDATRGALALLVVMHHILSDELGVHLLVQPAKIAVLIFYLMSGFVLARSWDGTYARFVVKRVVRLWPLFAVSMLAGSILQGVHINMLDLLWYPMLPYTTIPLADPPAWTLYYEAWAALFLPMGFLVARHSRPAAMLLVPGSMLLVLIDPRFSVAPIFAAGIALAQFDVRLPQRVPGWMVYLGKISFSLYITHAVVLHFECGLLGPWGVLLAVPIMAMVAVAAHYAIELPSIRASRQVDPVFDHLFLPLREGAVL